MHRFVFEKRDLHNQLLIRKFILEWVWVVPVTWLIDLFALMNVCKAIKHGVVCAD